MKPILKLGFADTFGTAEKFFTDVLNRRYTVLINNETPDYLIFGDGNFGQTHWKYQNCRKIFYTEENVRPSYYTYDHAITFDLEMSPKHYRLPLYVLEMDMMRWEGVVNDYMWMVNTRPDTDWDQVYEGKRAICTYLQSNPNCQVRNQFMQFLMGKKTVDCGGPHLNNIDKVIPRDIHQTIKFLQTGLFNVAFENGSYSGYTTEKILNCFYANTIPIYWGNPKVARDFNPKAFINCHDYKSFDDVLSVIEELRTDKDKYLDMLSQPAFTNNIPNQYTDLDQFLDWWDTFVYV